MTIHAVKFRQRPTRPKAGAILRGARKVFLERGYSGTSMDSVARESDVAKQTLYAHFKNKSELFDAVVNDFSAQYAPPVKSDEEEGADIKKTLRRTGEMILALLLAPDAVAAHRMVIAEATRTPNIGRLYYKSGPVRLTHRVENTLRRAAKNAQLEVANPKQAAVQFIVLVMGTLRLRALLCEPITEKEKRNTLNTGVAAFYRAYRP